MQMLEESCNLNHMKNMPLILLANYERPPYNNRYIRINGYMTIGIEGETMDNKKLEIEINILHQRICQALADPTRILILYHLSEKRHCVNELVEALNIPQSTISRHLSVLRERNLVETERDGAAIYYTLQDQRIIQALDIMREILATQLANSVELAQSLKK
jgi:ArsR family transcriptional regulator